MAPDGEQGRLDRLDEAPAGESGSKKIAAAAGRKPLERLGPGRLSRRGAS
jgi:hypothetical protein